MTIKKKEPRSKKIEIDITGPDGNAYALMSYAARYAKQLNLDGNAILNEMRSGDYENLLLVFDREFGEYVDLLR